MKMHHFGYLIVAYILTSSLRAGTSSINTCNCAVENLPYRHRQRRSRENPVPDSNDGFAYDEDKRRFRGFPDFPENSRSIKSQLTNLLPTRPRSVSSPLSVKARHGQTFPDASRKQSGPGVLEERLTSGSDYPTDRDWEGRSTVRPVWFKEDNEYQYGLTSYVESLIRRRRKFQDLCRCSPNGNMREITAKPSTRKPTRASPATKTGPRKADLSPAQTKTDSVRSTATRPTSAGHPPRTSSGAPSLARKNSSSLSPATVVPLTVKTYTPTSALRNTATSKPKTVSSRPAAPPASTARKSAMPLSAFATKTKLTSTKPTSGLLPAVPTARSPALNASRNAVTQKGVISPRPVSAPGMPPPITAGFRKSAKPRSTVAPATPAALKSTPARLRDFVPTSVVTKRNPASVSPPSTTAAVPAAGSPAPAKATNAALITTVPGSSVPSPTTPASMYPRLPIAAHLIAASPTWGRLPTNPVAMGSPTLGYYQPADTSLERAFLTTAGPTSTRSKLAAAPAATATWSPSWIESTRSTSSSTTRPTPTKLPSTVTPVAVSTSRPTSGQPTAAALTTARATNRALSPSSTGSTATPAVGGYTTNPTSVVLVVVLTARLLTTSSPPNGASKNTSTVHSAATASQSLVPSTTASTISSRNESAVTNVLPASVSRADQPAVAPISATATANPCSGSLSDWVLCNACCRTFDQQKLNACCGVAMFLGLKAKPCGVCESSKARCYFQSGAVEKLTQYAETA